MKTSSDDLSNRSAAVAQRVDVRSFDRTWLWRARRQAYRYAAYYPTVFLRGQWVPLYLNSLLRSECSSPQDLAAAQDRQLQSLGLWASQYVPYYKDFVDGGLTRLTLANIPVLNKQSVVQRQADLRATTKLLRRFPKTTGGSTGEPVTIDKDASALAWELAAAWRGYAWAGVSIGDPQGRLWGVPVTESARRTARMTDLLLHRRRCSAFPFTASDMDQFTNTLNRFQPTYLYGYVSMLVEYAQHLLNSSKQLKVTLRAVVTTSEVLEASQRKFLEDVFGCPVFNEYGCGEVGTIAHECESGSLHINSENVVVEVLQSSGRPSFVGEGSLLVTDLRNRAMPLIRYQIGDVGVLSDEPCQCGRGLQVLTKVFGRAYDTITSVEGKKFHGEFFMYMVEEAKRRGLGIDGFQIVQVASNELLLRLVPGKEFGRATEDFITSYLRDRFHPEVRVVISTVERIERERSGKMRVVVALK